MRPKKSFHWACVSFKGSVGVKTSGVPAEVTPVHQASVNAPMRSRWDWIIVCVGGWVCLFMCVPAGCVWVTFCVVTSGFSSSKCHLLKFWVWLFKTSKCEASVCLCVLQVCDGDHFDPPYTKVPSSQIVYNVTGIDVEDYLVSTANDFIRNRWIRHAADMYNLHFP